MIRKLCRTLLLRGLILAFGSVQPGPQVEEEADPADGGAPGSVMEAIGHCGGHSLVCMLDAG